MGRCSLCMPWVMALVFLLCVTSLAEAQSVPPCAQKLAPCLDYVNSTHPPDTCCDPLRETVANELTCLCNFYTTPGLLESFGINITLALQVGHRCGIKMELSDCTASAPAPAPAPSSSVTPPAATPGDDKGGGGRVAFSGLSFLLLFWASLFY